MRDIAVGRKRAVLIPTDASTLSFSIYLKELSKLKLISPTEETELIKKAQSGDEEARQKLIQAHLRFVVSVAKRYSNLGIPIEDLISEGNVGLVEAVDHYDSSYGCKFISYAVFRIRQKILAFLRQNAHIVKYPENLISLSIKIHNKTDEFIRKNGYPPTLEELRELLDNKYSLRNIAWAMKFTYGYESLDRPISIDEAPHEQKRMIDLLENEEQNVNESFDKSDTVKIVNKVLDKYLRPDEAKIIRMKFGIGLPRPMSLYEIAQVLNRSHEHVRKKSQLAMQRLRSNGKAMALLSACI